jgi:hypothetical protein
VYRQLRFFLTIVASTYIAVRAYPAGFTVDRMAVCTVGFRDVPEAITEADIWMLASLTLYMLLLKESLPASPEAEPAEVMAPLSSLE